MSWFLFIDESGHDHRNAPYEVTGGVALHITELWGFTQSIQALELRCFGCRLRSFGSELKGHRLLDKDRFKWAQQMEPLDEETRQSATLSFLQKGRQRYAARPTWLEFTAYGQASLAFVDGAFDLLREYGAIVLASAIPRGVRRPANLRSEMFLRKDFVFLAERYYYHLHSTDERGIYIMDETEEQADWNFYRQLERYFLRTEKGRERSDRVIPCPFLVRSHISYPIQVADVVIYAINYGFRIENRGMDAPTRDEIRTRYGGPLYNLQWRGVIPGTSVKTFGICYVSDPYEGRLDENACP